MTSEYRDVLPASVQALIDEIERAAGCEIQVERVPSIPTEMRANIPPEARPRPIIQYRDSWDAVSKIYPSPYTMVAHEVLHLHRYFVDRVPGMHLIDVGLSTPDFGTITPDCFPSDSYAYNFAQLDAILEHLTIDTRLQSLGFSVRYGSRPFWSTYAPQSQVACVRDWLAYSIWLQSLFVERDPEVIALAESKLKQYGMFGQADRLRHGFQLLLASPDPAKAKIAMCIAFAGAVGLPQECMRLQYCWGEGAGRANEPLPAVVEVPLSVDNGITYLARFFSVRPS